MSWTKLRLAMMNNSMLNSTCSSVKTTSVIIASIQGLLKKITVKSSTRTQQTELPITNSSLSANKATSSSTWYESEAAIAQNHRLSAKRKKDSYYNDMYSNYMEDLLEYGYMIQVELQSPSQQATYFIIWWAKRPAHQQGSDKSSKRRQSQKLVSHSILCTGPIENLIIVMGDITKTYVFFSQYDISDNSKHSRSPEEDYSEQLYKNATKRATDNKFIVKVPIKQQAVPFGTNLKAAIAQNHRLSAKRKKDSYYNDMYSNYMEDLLEFGYMTQVELQSSSQQATYFIMRWAKRPAHQQGSDKSSKRRQSQKLVSHSILCTGPNENPIIVMGDITKTYVFFS